MSPYLRGHISRFGAYATDDLTRQPEAFNPRPQGSRLHRPRPGRLSSQPGWTHSLRVGKNSATRGVRRAYPTGGEVLNPARCARPAAPPAATSLAEAAA